MTFRTIVANGLAHLLFLQFSDHDRADPERDEQRRQHTQDAAQGDVLHHQKTAVVLRQIFRQPKQHQRAPSVCVRSCVSRCTTASIPALRDPFTNTVPPCASTGALQSAAC